MSDSNKALNGMCHGRALLFIFRGVDVQPGLFFIVAEEGIDPAPDLVSRQEAVIGPDPAKPLVNGYGKGFPGVDGMVQSPVHDNNQDPFFSVSPEFSARNVPYFSSPDGLRNSR